MEEVRLYEMYLNEAIEGRKKDLLEKSEDYKKLKENFREIMNNYPKLQLILENDNNLVLDEDECKMLQKLVAVYIQLSDLEEKEIFLLGGKEKYGYLKDVGLIKEK